MLKANTKIKSVVNQILFSMRAFSISKKTLPSQRNRVREVKIFNLERFKFKKLRKRKIRDSVERQIIEKIEVSNNMKINFKNKIVGKYTNMVFGFIFAFAFFLNSNIASALDTTPPTVDMTYSINPMGVGSRTIKASYSEAIQSAPTISIDQPGSTDISNASMTNNAGSIWTSRSVNEYYLQSVAYGNGLFVAVGSSAGHVATSPDGITWTTRTPSLAANWQSVAYGNGLFVAVSYGGNVMTSPDGITWITRTASETNQWVSIVYANNIFVAVATSGTNRVMTSPDGITWTARAAAEANVWNTVTYGNGLFVAGGGIFSTHHIMTSPDGITWTARTAATANTISGIAYGNGIFTATNQTNQSMTSPDGINWTSQTMPSGSAWYGITYGSGMFVTVAVSGTNRMATSLDGITWIVQNSSTSLTLTGITFGNGLFVAVGTGGYSILTSPGFTYSYNYNVNQANGGTYVDGTATVSLSSVLDLAGNASSAPTHNTFTIDTVAPTVALSYSASPAGVGTETITAVYSKPISTVPTISINQPGSTDISNATMTPPGSVWTTRTVPQANSWTSVAYGNGLFVAVSTNGTNTVMTSPDGITWTSRTAPASSTWYSVTYGNGLFVAVSQVGTNRVMTSPDGITWTARTAAQVNSWISVTYGNGLFVAVSTNGTNTVMTSPDGITWTARTIASTQTMSVTFGNGIFMAASLYNQMFTSVDGILWSALPTPPLSYFDSISYGNGVFVAVGYQSTGKLAYSIDNGVTWTTLTSMDASAWRSVTYANGLFVVVGDAGAVMTSPGVGYTYDYIVNKANGGSYVDGTATVSLSSVTDIPGNTAAAPTNTTFSIDTTGPTVALTYSASPAKAGTNTITATYSEAIVGTPTISINQPGTTDITNVSMSGSGKTWTYSYTVNTANGTTYVDGGAIVSLSIVNNATGHSSLPPTNTNFIIDTTAPTLTYTYSTNPIKAGLTETITASYSEAIIGTPTISIDQPGTTDISNATLTNTGASIWTGWTATSGIWSSIAYGNGLFVAVTGTATTYRVMTSPDGITWTGRSAAQANSWTSVAYGNGLFVAVSSDGTNQVMTSPDGINWTARVAAAANQWQGISYLNGQFVAVSNTGTNRIMTSSNGITWVLQTSPDQGYWVSVAYGNSTYVAVATFGTNRVYTSTNGTAWVGRTAIQANTWRSVTYGNGLFVAVSSDGTNRVMTSPDGTTWTARSAAQANSWQAVTYANGLFVAVSNDGTNRVMTSADGITWTVQTAASASTWASITYGNGLFVAGGGSSTLMTSPAFSYSYNYTVNQANGGTYVDGAATVSLPSTTDLAGNTLTTPTTNTFIIDTTGPATALSYTKNPAGLGVNIITATYNEPISSSPTISVNQPGSTDVSNASMIPPANTWTARTITSANQWRSITYGNNIFVAVSGSGTNRVMTSPDGITWTERSAAQANTWNSITYGNGLFVAVSSDGTNRVMTSPDGITWISRNAAIVSTWQSVAYGGGVFVAVASNSVMTSPDGINWTARTASVVSNWTSVAYGNGLFVAVSSYSTNVMTSPDGITWTTRIAPSSSYWYSIAYGNGTFVAVENGSNCVMTSPDGITWTARAGAVPAGWQSVIYGDGTFVIVGNSNVVMTSINNGTTWTSRTSPASVNWSAIAYGKGTFVAISNGSTSVITSPSLGYSYSYTVSPANGSTYIDGTTAVSLSSVNDLAGNASQAPTNATFEINTAPPTVAMSYSKTPAGVGAMTITATYNKPVVSAPNISINQPGSTDISNVAMTGSGAVYTYSYTVNIANGSTYIDGVTTVSLSSVLDADGNTAVAPTNTTFTIETVPPTAVITYSINHATKTGDSQVITATFSEPMADAPIPKIAISGTNTVAATNMTKVDTTHYTYTHTVAAGNGNANVALSVGTDVGTNPLVATPTSGATFAIDNIIPTGTITAVCTVAGNGCTVAGGLATPQQVYTLASLAGTATDETTLSRVDLSIKDTNTNKYYNGVTFTSDTEVFQTATGTSTWSYNALAIPLTIDHIYTVNVKPYDVALNTNGVSVNFKFVNSPPTVSNVVASQALSGDVAVSYDVTDIESAQTTNSLFFNSGLTLSGSITDSVTSLTVSNGTLLSNTGTIMIDDEIISYTGKTGNTLSGLTRGYLSTTPFAHNGSAVYIYAATATGTGIGLSNKGTGKSITWTARNDANGFEFTTGDVKVVANDGSAGSMIGSMSSPVFKFDAKKPSAIVTFDAGVAGSANSGTVIIPLPTDISTVEYKISDDALTQTNPTDTGWTTITQSTTIPWSFDSDIEVKTLKYQWRDVYGNVSPEQTISTHAPIPSSSFMVQDTSNITAVSPYYDMYIGWQSTDQTNFASYKLEYATSSDNTTYTSYQDIVDSSLSTISSNYYFHRNLNSNLYYRYRLGVLDTNGNISVRSNSSTTTKPDGVQNYGEGGGGSVATAPKVENVVVTQNEDKTVSISYKLTDSSLAKKVSPSYEGYLFYNIGITIPADALNGNSLTLSDASKLKSSGYILVNNEVIKYTGKSSNTLTGITRSSWPALNSSGRLTRSNATFFTGTPVWVLANGTTPISITNTTITTGQNGTITWNTYDEPTLAGSTFTNVGVKVLVHDNQDALSGPLSSQNDYSNDGVLNNLDLTAPVISFATTSSTALESITPVVLTLNLARAYPLDTTVTYTLGGTATSGSDYTLSNGTATILAGQTSTTIEIPIIDDTLKELDETIIVTLSSPVNATPGGNNVYTYTIIDNDSSSTIEFTNTSGEGSLGATPVNIPVSLSAISGADVTASYTISGTAVNGVDYNLSNGTITILKGQTTANISLPILNDKLKKADTNVILTLSLPTNGTLGANTTYTYTILNDNNYPTIGFIGTSGTGLESATPVNIPVSLSTTYPSDVTVAYTISGTAVNGTDYDLSDGIVTIIKGETTANISLPVLNDKLKKENRNVIFTLSSPTNATLNTNTVYTYTIFNENSLPMISFTTTEGSGAQSVSAVNIPVSIPETYQADVTVEYKVTGGTAIKDTDYTLADGTLTIKAGDTTSNISATILNSIMASPSETFIVTLSNPSNAIIVSNNIYTYTINDDHAFPTIGFTVLTSEANVDGGTAKIPVSITTASSRDITIDYAVTGGTALPEVDYSLSNGTLSILAGSTTGDIVVAIAASKVYGDTKTLIVSLSNPSNATLGSSNTHTLSILNNNIAISKVESVIKATSARITWTTADFTDSKIEYGIVPPPGDEVNIPYNLSKLNSTQVLDHSMYLGNLTPSTKYYYKTTSTNLSGVLTVNEGDFTTTAGPVINTVSSSDVTDVAATITWNTDIPASSYVSYTTDLTSLTKERFGTAPLVTTHSVTITGLKSSIMYYYSVDGSDADSNTSEDTNDGNYDTFTTLADHTPPEISNIGTPVITATQVAIVWNTNEISDGKVEYSTTKAVYDNQTELISLPLVNHLVAINELKEKTKYYYVVISADPNGNIATSDEQTFTTLAKDVTYVAPNAPMGVAQSLYDAILAQNDSYKAKYGEDVGAPTVSNIVVSDITPFGATVSYDTNIDSIAFIDYGKDQDYGLVTANKSWSKSHLLKLTGLNLGTEYSFKINAMSKTGNMGYSDNQKFTTKFLSENLAELKKIENVAQFQAEIESTIESILPSLVPPFIDKPVISDITESSATVSFRTNVKSYPSVSYTMDSTYDVTKTNPYDGETSDTSVKDVNHTLNILGLKPNTKYHIMAKAFSLPQVIGKSGDVTFTTQASKIRGSVINIKTDSFTVVWNTDEPTTSIVEYKNLKTGRISRLVDDVKNSSHSIKIENLTPGTSYEISISGINSSGNLVEGSAPFNVRTSIDNIPPQISNIKVESALIVGRTDKVQTIVSWNTDEAATSAVYYEEGSGSPTAKLANKQEDLELTKNHVVIISNFKPGTIYRFTVSSSDSAGNNTLPPVRTIITPKKTDSIVDVIFKNFDETFNFVNNVR